MKQPRTKQSSYPALPSLLVGATLASIAVVQHLQMQSLSHERSELRLALQYAVDRSLVDRDSLHFSNAMLAGAIVRVSELHNELAEQRILARILRVNRRAPHPERTARAIVASATAVGLNPYWWAAQIEQESHYNPRAIGPSGERGLAQISRRTAPLLGLQWQQAFDPEANLAAGAQYMAQHVANFGGNINAALLRYNGGGEAYPRLVASRLIPQAKEYPNGT